MSHLIWYYELNLKAAERMNTLMFLSEYLRI